MRSKGLPRGPGKEGCHAFCRYIIEGCCSQTRRSPLSAEGEGNGGPSHPLIEGKELSIARLKREILILRVSGEKVIARDTAETITS